MIVLGPMDAELNGAPPYWRSGNWRPNARPLTAAPFAYTTCPFDKCDLVLEYDARWPERPTPADQGWRLGGRAETVWRHDAARGALQFSLPDEIPSFWSAEQTIDPAPDRAVAYGLFLVDPFKEGQRAGILDFVTQASPREGRSRGMRGSWADGWTYRRLDSGAAIPMVQPTAVRSLTAVWHALGLDAELTGPTVQAEGVEPNDGGRTIGSLDGILNNDPRRSFGYGNAAASQAFALFGKTESRGSVTGWLRNYYASFPGRFLRAGFRAVALGETTLLRFVFCAELDRGSNPGTAAFLVRYASPSLGLDAAALPAVEAPRAVAGFDSSKTVEVRVELARLVAGEELWFTIERDWRHEADELRATLHLLMVVVQEAGR